MLLFENFNEIHKICQEYGIENYIINTDGTIDVDGNVYLFYKNLKKLPLKFRNVSGYFDCSRNKLTTLVGAPLRVGIYFDCSRNKLTTLEYAPQSVGGYFKCTTNKLTTLEGLPISSIGWLYCSGNPIHSSKYLKPYAQTLDHIDKYKKVPKELVTPGLMSFLKEVDKSLYNKIKTMFDQDTIDTLSDMGDIGF